MPLFSSQPNQASTAAWEPPAADSRLAGTVGADEAGVFTSDLSVSEYVLLGEAGFEPLGFVVGSSIYHVGIQVGRWSQNQELQVITQAMYNARELAMARMRSEADHLGADGIVGVNLRMQVYAWGQDVLEFVATGTAVKALAGTGAHRAPDGGAFTSDLSAQDFYRLLAAGGGGGAAGARGRALPPPAPGRARCRSPSCSAPASTTSRTRASCSRCARPGRTRRWCSSPRASTRPVSWR